MLKGKFAFLGNSEYYSKKTETTYYKAKFISETGQELELETQGKLDIPQFTQCIVEVDILQGKFPRFIYKKHEFVK